MTILKPSYPQNHPDRFSECQGALEDRLLELLGDAIEAGWTKDEVLAAMITVADNTSLAMHENVLLSVETELRKLMKKQ
ncbi:hypothetical protein LJR231_000664 [Phyllobacterium sp. LjRoot231]|uniref:hypothetical protein n=1 Tax=Phyllobacterium sp. LjRoot231 TaxID=3342289 RepID=UPI003ECD328A